MDVVFQMIFGRQQDESIRVEQEADNVQGIA